MKNKTETRVSYSTDGCKAFKVITAVCATSCDAIEKLTEAMNNAKAKGKHNHPHWHKGRW